MVTGAKTIWVDFRVNDKATFAVGKAYFQQLHIPAVSVEKMIQVLAARQPEK